MRGITWCVRASSISTAWKAARNLAAATVLAIVALTGGAPTGLAVAASDPPLVLAMDEWPPFSGVDLPGQGISLDLIKAVLKRAGYTVEIEVLPWARIMHGAQQDRSDLVGSLFYDGDPAQHLTHSEPYYETAVKFAHRLDAGHRIEDFYDLRSLWIAVGDGFLYEQRFGRATELEKVTVTTKLRGARKLAAGRADLTLDSEEVLIHALRVGGPTLNATVEIPPYVTETQEIRLGANRRLQRADRVLADFNRTLVEMRGDSSLTRLLERHHVH